MSGSLGMYLAKNFDSYLFNPFEEYSLEGIELFEGELLSLRESLSGFNISFGDKAA